MSITAVGVHTFFVGFQRGMESVLGRDNVLGSMEGWKPGIDARRACGAGHLPITELPRGRRVDLVFSNPPCSRYSSMSTGAYDQQDKSRLVSFCELGTAVDVAMQLGASALWWETGPLLWSKGMEMVADVHQALERTWGEPSTTVVVKTDLRYFGVPQRRPRCHVLHARGLWEPPEPGPAAWPPERTVQSWLRERVPDPTHWFRPLGDARKEVIRRRFFSSFMSSRPTMVRAGAVHAPAVISAREFAWEDPCRWWAVEEYASLMCYPVEETIAVSEAFNPRYAKTMLAKSVSPSAAAGVWRSFFEPTLRTPGEGGVWRVQATVRDGASCAVAPEVEDEVTLETLGYRRIVETAK